MQVTFNIPNAAASRIVDAFCAEFNYQEQITNENGEVVENPETKAAFTKRHIVEHIKQVTRNYEGNRAAEAARQAKAEEINSVSIT